MLSFDIVRRIGEGKYAEEDAFIIERVRKKRALNARGIRVTSHRNNYKYKNLRDSTLKGG